MKKAISAVLLAILFTAGGWYLGNQYFISHHKTVKVESIPLMAKIDFAEFNKLVDHNAAKGKLILIPGQGAVFEGTIQLPSQSEPVKGLVAINGFYSNVNASALELYKKHNINNHIALAVAPKGLISQAFDKSSAKKSWTHYLLNGFYVAIDVAIVLFLLMQFKGLRKRYNVVDRPLATFSDVAGLTGPKQEVREIVDYLKEPAAFNAIGAHGPRGILLWGPPGNGKTLLAKAVAGEAGIKFIEQNASSFVQMFAGAGAMSVRALFREARSNAPCVIFIDEIDAVGASRFGGDRSHDERLQTLNALLAEMDGMANNEGIVVMAATNQPDALDPALLRPGRFDRKVMIPLPGREDRKQILSQYLAKIKVDGSINIDSLVRQSTSFSGADLANWCNEAAIEASRAHASAVTWDHFKVARDRILIGPRNHGISMTEKERSTTAWHEAGHAVVRLATGGKVDKVSILPRGQALGVTVSMAEDDSVFRTKEHMDTELQVLMGGRAAEELFCGEITTGASNDMARASDIARVGILQYGFGNLGPYVPQSTKLIEEQERLAADWVRASYDKAKELLLARRAEVEALRDRLIAEEEVSFDN